MKKITLSTFLQAKINTYIFKYFHPRLTYCYVYALGKLYFFFNKKERQTIQKNVNEVVGRSNSKIVKNVYKGIIKHYYEKLLMAYYDLNKFLAHIKKNAEIKGKEILDEALKSGNGVILATAHFGAVEYLPVILALSDYRVNVTVKFKTQKLKETLQERADKMNIGVLNCAETNNILFKASNCLKNNEILMTEIDEVEAWTKDDKRTVELFQQKVYLDRGIDILSRRTKANVLAIFAKRESNGKLKIEISDINNIHIPQDHEHKESFVFRLLNVFQNYVSAYPDQWYEWKKWQSMKVAESA